MSGWRYTGILLILLALSTLIPAWAGNKALAYVEEKGQGAATKEGETAGPEAAGESGKQEEKEEGKAEECPPTFGPIITDSAVPIDQGMFAIQPFFYLGFVTGIFDRNWKPVSARGNFTSFNMPWRFVYGPMKNMEVYVMIPYIQKWASDVDTPGPGGKRSADSGGLGDIDVTLKYQLVEDGPRTPTVTATFATDFPTGHFRHLNPRLLGTDAIGSGSYIFTGGLDFQKCLNPFILYANLWYSVSTAFTQEGLREIDKRRYPRDFATVNLAGEYVISKNKKWVALLELTSFWDGGRLFGRKANVAPQALASVLPAIEYIATEKLSFALGVNVDCLGKSYPANVTPVFSITYEFGPWPKKKG